MNEWLEQIDGLVEFLKNSPQAPVTFLIGAGASISSGGPTTPEVRAALEAVHGGPFTDNTKLTAAEKESIHGLFTKFEPYIGYHALAAMGRTRPIYVLNLNWDDGLERAAKAAGAKYVSISITDPDPTTFRRLRRAERQPSPGIVCIHLHGVLPGGDYRFNRLETLTFELPLRSVIVRLLRHTTVIIGASLRSDYDMTKVLLEATEDESPANALWLLSREARSIEKDAQLFGMYARRSGRIVEHEALCFDRALLYLHTASGNLPYEEFVRKYYPTRSPNFANLVFPRPEVVRPLLKQRAIAIVADPQIGKTRIGCLLAFFFKSCLKSHTEKEVMVTRDVTSCTSVLANYEGILHLDRPFGRKEFESNPQFFSVLARKLKRAAALARETRILIECTPTAWQKAVDEYEGDIGAILGSTAETLDGWYDRADLLALIDAKEHPDIAQAIEQGSLRTPGQVIAALESGIALPPQSPEAIDEKRRHLLSLGKYGKVVVLVRLLHLATKSRPWRNLVLDAGFRDEPDVVKNVARWVETFRIDEHEFARLLNGDDAGIIDEVLDDPSSALLASVQEPNLSWVSDALRVRDAVKAVRNGDTEAILKMRKDGSYDFGELAPTLLQIAHDDWLLQFIDHREMDLCSLRDFAFELVRLWRNLRDSRAAQAIVEELVQTHQGEGLYALLEAALFLEDFTHEEIWEYFAKPLLDLSRSVESGRDPSIDRQALAAMVFDGMLWRDNPSDTFASRWFQRFFDAVDDGSALAGAFAFSLVYHGSAASEHLRRHKLGQQCRLERINRLTPEQAERFCWMMRWHFEHECRDRAIMLRRDQLSKSYLKFIRRTDYGETAPTEEAPILVAALHALKRNGHAGWAFHLALNMMTVNGHYGPEVAAELPGLLDAAPNADNGVVLAAMNYTEASVVGKLQHYFSNAQNRTALLDAFANGICCNNEIDVPKFDYSRDPFEVMSMLDIRWLALEKLGAQFKRDEFIPWIHGLAAHAHVPPEHEDGVRRVLKRAARGDLRPFEDAARRLLASMSPEAARERLIEEAVPDSVVRPSQDVAVAPPVSLRTSDTPDEWLRRLDDIVRATLGTKENIGVLNGFISASATQPDLQRRLAEAHEQRARLRIRSSSVEPNAHFLIKNDLREAVRLHQRHFEVTEAQRLETQLRQIIWDHDLKPAQKRPSRGMQEKIDLHPPEIVEKTIAIHARLSRPIAAAAEGARPDRFKNFATKENLWEEALREATRERTLFE